MILAMISDDTTHRALHGGGQMEARSLGKRVGYVFTLRPRPERAILVGVQSQTRILAKYLNTDKPVQGKHLSFTKSFIILLAVTRSILN